MNLLSAIFNYTRSARKYYALMRLLGQSLYKRFRVFIHRSDRHILVIDSDNFDREFYVANNPDVATSGLPPFQHFMRHGRHDARPYRFFDNSWYLRQYPHLKVVGIDPALHFHEFGETERKRARFISARNEGQSVGRSGEYRRWLAEYEDRFSPPNLGRRESPMISVVLPVYDPPAIFLEAAIQSVLDQTYQNWELCIADDCSREIHIREIIQRYSKLDERIKIAFRESNGHISAATNSAIALATGEFIAFLDHDDVLAPDALAWVSAALDARPSTLLIYSDEDKIDGFGNRFEPYFKPDFNYELLLAQNYICHFLAVNTDCVRRLGGLRTGLEGAQDHDLVLRVTETISPEAILHIPRVLYHWRAITGSTALASEEKGYASAAGLRAVSEHLKRIGREATVEAAFAARGHYRVRYRIPSDRPKVSIIVPTRDRLDLLSVCIASVLKISTYRNFEIIIVDNGSLNTETKNYLDQARAPVRVIHYDYPFNFSELVNFGVHECDGSIICLLNNDIEVSSPDWLEEMVAFALQPDVGCVGARLWYPDGRLQHGGVILGLGGVAEHAHKFVQRGDPGYFFRAVDHQSMSAVTAACLVVRKDVFVAVGGFDTRFAVAFNDVDFCLRVKAAGFRNVWTPYAELIHHESATRGPNESPEKSPRFNSEIALMNEIWGEALAYDPAYSPNLTKEAVGGGYAWPPRAWRWLPGGSTENERAGAGSPS